MGERGKHFKLSSMPKMWCYIPVSPQTLWRDIGASRVVECLNPVPTVDISRISTQMSLLTHSCFFSLCAWFSRCPLVFDCALQCNLIAGATSNPSILLSVCGVLPPHLFLPPIPLYRMGEQPPTQCAQKRIVQL